MMKKLFFAILISAGFWSAAVFSQSKGVDEESLRTVENIKTIERRFQVAITQTDPLEVAAQKDLLRESFQSFYSAAELAEKKPSEILISAVVRLGNMLIDNDLSEGTSDRLYRLYQKHSQVTAAAIAQLDAASAKKLRSALKARQKVHKGARS